MEAVELEATSADRSVLDAVEFLTALRGAKAALVPEQIVVERPGPGGEPVAVTLSIDVDAFASLQWRKTVRDPARPGMLVRRHLEVCVFSYLAAELRSGDIAVAAARRSIRRRYAEGEVSLADLATEYSVGRSTIHRIIHGPPAGQS